MEEDGLDGQHGLGQHGQDGVATHIHSADGIHGCLEDGGECRIYGGGGKCPLVWDPMAG